MSMIFGGLFDVEVKKEKIKELENIISSSNFWDDVEEANKVIKEQNNLRKDVEEIEDIKESICSLISLVELITEEDESTLKEIEAEVLSIDKRIETFSLKKLLGHKYDSYNCILEIHPGAGGTEAMDWAGMLLEMYERYCNKKGYEFIILDEQKGEEAGIKSVTVRIVGEYAFGYLKSERGVHRLVRISPFDSNARRHTSFASVSVTPEVNNNKSIEINPNDLKIDVFHSGGAGGQSVNTTDSAVRITHLPTKIVVTCQKERSQIKNKEIAMGILISKLVQLKEEEEEKELAKLRGQNLNIDFGSQIRNYTLEPYKLIKDTRFEYETSNVDDFLNGEIDEIIEVYLKSDLNK